MRSKIYDDSSNVNNLSDRINRNVAHFARNID